MKEKLKLSEKFLKEAWKQLERYKDTKEELCLWQACEKGWGAVAHALKAVNPQIKRHADFGKTAAKLAEAYHQEFIIYGEACGETLHRSGFYERALDEKAIFHQLKCIEDFLKLIEKILNSKENIEFDKYNQ